MRNSYVKRPYYPTTHSICLQLHSGRAEGGLALLNRLLREAGRQSRSSQRSDIRRATARNEPVRLGKKQKTGVRTACRHVIAGSVLQTHLQQQYVQQTVELSERTQKITSVMSKSRASARFDHRSRGKPSRRTEYYIRKRINII